MRRTLKWMLWCGGVIAGTTLPVDTVRATPAVLFTSTPIADSGFGEIDVMNHVLPYEAGPNQASHWISIQKTKGPSHLYVQNNVWQPGGTTGWHTHPGHSLIMVLAGTLTVYDGDDPSCTGVPYSAGQTLVDPGAGHAHVIRNDGDVEARTVVVQLVAEGAPRRVDAEMPDACPNGIQ